MKSVDLSDHFSIRNDISTNASTTTPTHAYPYIVQGRKLPSSSCPSIAPPPEAPSSFSSIMSSPLSARISFQTLTNFIPISWSQRSNVPASLSSGVDGAPKPDDVTPRRASVPLKRGFVSKERQLEKLRSRLEREGTMKMRTSVSVCCNQCAGDVVAL